MDVVHCILLLAVVGLAWHVLALNSRACFCGCVCPGSGIYVQSAIQRQDQLTGLPVGPQLQTIESGAVVVVTIVITLPDVADNVIVTALAPGGTCRTGLHVMCVSVCGCGCGCWARVTCTWCSCVSAGLEPMDTLVAVDLNGNPTTSYCGGGTWYYWWCAPPFGSPQVMADRVTWSASYLYAGTYTLTYNALAVTTGACAA